jgi:Ku70/Ku80 beta-barrel domain
VVAFSGLVKAMKEKQVAAIVRRVALANGKLQLGALMPRIIADEDVRIYYFCFQTCKAIVFLALNS